MKRTLLLGILALVALLRGRSSPALATRETPPPDPPARAAARVVVKHPWLSLAALLLGAGVFGALTVVSGVVPIKASSGHWAITRWFLEFSMARSIATHSLFIDPPALDDPALVLRGAGHYELGCRPCHGAPGTAIPRIPAAMTPRPPELPPRIPHWAPEELFSIVKHGIKLTGMPAWPAQQRDDEVWAMVAFLRRLPELDAREYGALARGDPTTVADLAPASEPGPGAGTVPPSLVVDICARCHGVDGTGRGLGAFPVLAGQRSKYLENSLRAYARGERYSGVMGPSAAALPPESVAAISEYYAGLGASAIASPQAGLGQPTTRGEAIAMRGVPDRDIPACVECHGPTATPRNPAYPVLGGQYADYLVLQLELLKDRRRGGSPYVRLMHAFVDRLTPDQIRQVTQYFASSTGPAALRR